MTDLLFSPHSIIGFGPLQAAKPNPILSQHALIKCHQEETILPHSCYLLPNTRRTDDATQSVFLLSVTVYADGLKGKMIIIWKTYQEFG